MEQYFLPGYPQLITLAFEFQNASLILMSDIVKKGSDENIICMQGFIGVGPGSFCFLYIRKNSLGSLCAIMFIGSYLVGLR